MKTTTLEILRCPYCGGRFVLDRPSSHDAPRGSGVDIDSGLLACACAVFPVVSGIPVIRSDDRTRRATQHVRDGRMADAECEMFEFEGEQAERFHAAILANATYRDVLAAIDRGTSYEDSYFFFRFSDPSYVVADALIRSVGGAVLNGGRAIDLCGGSGHLTRALARLSPCPPVLADLYFLKLWLARRFVAEGCEAVCCNANSPLPFARGAFRYAMCADAFMFVWSKRRFVDEMLRLVDDCRAGGAVVISHTHNRLQWGPALGDALRPDGYRDLFESIEPRLFGEAGLFTDVVEGGCLDLTRRDPPDVLDGSHALEIIATRQTDVFRMHTLGGAARQAGRLRLNPLYRVDVEGDRVQLRLQFPSRAYEEEFSACRAYLPETATISTVALSALDTGYLTSELAELVRRRVVLDLPRRYY